MLLIHDLGDRVTMSSDGPRVLLVDDALRFRAQLRAVLEDYGLVVVGEAGTGGEGVELACRLDPEVVMMDLRMPDMDGITATRRLRERLPSARVMVVSAYDDMALKTEAAQAGAFAYLVKGCPIGEVVDAITAAAADRAAHG
jgi:DNA-binding NarL/FixJ family response regulator